MHMSKKPIERSVKWVVKNIWFKKKEDSYSSDYSGFVLILLNFFHWGLIHKGIWLLKIAVMS